MIKIIFYGISILYSAALWAGTIVEIHNSNELTTLYTDGQFAKIELPMSEYALVDHEQSDAKIINASKKEITLLTINDIDPRRDVNAVDIKVIKEGQGIMVAGYATQKYRYSANGKMCGIIFGSRAAYEEKGVKEIFSAINILMKKQYAVLGGFARLVDACTLADMQVGDFVHVFGVPMRIEKSGIVDSEVKSISVDVELPVDSFILPADYKVINI